MATIKADMTIEFTTTKDGDLEKRDFVAGESVRIIKTWEAFYLVKDDDGHYHNVSKDCVTVGEDE